VSDLGESKTYLDRLKAKEESRRELERLKAADIEAMRQSELLKSEDAARKAREQRISSEERLREAQANVEKARRASDESRATIHAFSSSTHAKSIDTNDVGYKPSWTVTSTHGDVRSELICPHCSKKGMVHTKSVDKKVGVSGGKATGALLTGGLSLLFVGLSRKEKVTQAHCGNCESTWQF